MKKVDKVPMNYKLMSHQETVIEKAKQKNLLLMHACGCGKTLSAIEIIKHHGGNTLVCCPLTLIQNAWFVDCKRFAPDLDIVSLWSKKPAERRQRLEEDHQVYIVNYEGFKSLFDSIQKKKFNTIIVDESSAMKNPASQTTQSLLAMAGIKLRKRGGRSYKVGHIIPNRYCLSGTPAPNTPLEFWGQAKFVTGPGNVCFSDNYYSFRRKFATAIPLGMTGQSIWRMVPDRCDQLMEEMLPHADVVRIEDVLDLKPQTHIIRTVALSKDENAAYETFRKDLVLRFKNETILATSALVQVMKLRQLTSGFMYGDTGLHQIGNTKLNECLEILEEIGAGSNCNNSNRVIIWANFRQEIEMLHKAIPNSATLYGGTSDKDTSISDFRSGNCPVLIANPASAAHGLTFTECRYNIYFSLDYSYERWEQSIHRTYRYGQTEGVIYYYIIAKNSIDEVVYDAVHSKGDINKSALSYLIG